MCVVLFKLQITTLVFHLVIGEAPLIFTVYDLSFDLLLFTVSFPWHIYEITSCLSYLAILLIEVFECFAWGKAIKIFVH